MIIFNKKPVSEIKEEKKQEEKEKQDLEKIEQLEKDFEESNAKVEKLQDDNKEILMELMKKGVL